MPCVFIPRDSIHVKNRERPVNIFEVEWNRMDP